MAHTWLYLLLVECFSKCELLLFFVFYFLYFVYVVVGGVFMVEHLNIFKIILEKAAKYLLLPGLALDVNLNIRVCFLPCTVLALFTCLWYTR
jgi:hypothetical protein